MFTEHYYMPGTVLSSSACRWGRGTLGETGKFLLQHNRSLSWLFWWIALG